MFNPEEKAAILPGLQGAELFGRGVEALGASLNKLTTKNRPIFVEACKQTVRASRDVNGGVLGLLGAMPEDRNEGTRLEQLNNAFDHHFARALGDGLSNAVLAAASVAPEASALFEEARTLIARVNRAALMHSDPPPQDAITPDGRRNVIGPHADYFRAAHFGWTSTHYMDDWASEGFVPVLAGCMLKVRAAMGQSFGVYGFLMRLQLYVMTLNVGIPMHAAWTSLPVLQKNPQFSLTHASLGLLGRAVDLRAGDGIPAVFQLHENIWLDVHAGVRRREMPAWIQGARRRSDAWARENMEAWMLGLFPDGRAGIAG
jgi:hypothetical protein